MKKSIIGIPFSEETPQWQSSTPLPEHQLSGLARHSAVEDLPLEFQGFHDYNYDENFAKLIDGKRIAYVCPSPHLVGKKMGKLIDSYDLVVRINQAYEMPEELWEDYGSRTDILMNCLNIKKIRALREGMDFARSLKYIVCPMVSMWDVQRVHDFLDEIGTPWHNVNDGYLFKIFKEVGTTCNTGLTGLITMLNYDVKELFVTGMTFFNMNTFGKVYYDKYHDEAAKNNNFRQTKDKTPSIEELRIDIHQQEPQIHYFNKILLHYYKKPVTLDEYLENNFNLALQDVFSDRSERDIENIMRLDLFLKTNFKLTITDWEGEL
jgi:hypothetical protein